MNSSFYNGISGTKTNQFGIDVWAGNIANIDMAGFKADNPEFSNIFSTSLSDGYFNATADQIGLGARPAASTTDLSQGVLMDGGSVFDMAISGNGWFGTLNENGQMYHTRSGVFSKDSEGYLVDLSGNYLCGTLGNNISGDEVSVIEGDIDLGSTSKINLPDGLVVPAEPTANLLYKANLDPEIIMGLDDITLDQSDYSSAVNVPGQTISINGGIINTPNIQNPLEGDTVFLTITDANGKSINTSTDLDAANNWSLANYDISSLDLTDPSAITVDATLRTVQEIANVEHFTTEIISPAGNRDVLDMTFTKQVPQAATGSTWDALVQTATFYEDYDPSKSYDTSLYKIYENRGSVYEIVGSETGTVDFNTEGVFLNTTLSTIDNSGTSLALDFGTPFDATVNGSGYDGLSSLSGLTSANLATKDGYISGNLKNYGMDGNGHIVADFDNGRSTPIAKVALFHFQNDQGLEKINSTHFKESANSGEAFYFTDSDGNPDLGAKIVNYKLENSNVNFATALTELIVLQKAFDASAKSITTSDQMIQRAINMKT